MSKIHGNTGKKFSKETKMKIGLKTRERAERTRLQRSQSMKGKLAGDKNPSKRPEVREKIRLAKLGKKQPNISNAKKGKPNPNQSGEKSNFWKGGITEINKLIRTSTEYKLWREAVFLRDNFTCIWCKQQGGRIEADHIKKFSDYPELRFAIDNGRTLCKPCHKTTDTYGRKK